MVLWSYGQSADSLHAAEIYQKAEDHYSKSQYDSAFAAYQKAMTFFESGDAWEGYSRCLYDMGYISYKRDEYDLCDSLFRKGMQVAENKIGRHSLSWVKNCYGLVLRKSELDEFDSLLYFIDMALPELKKGTEYESLKLKLLDKKASTYNRLGIYKSSIDTWLQYIDVVNDHFNGDTTELILAYEQLGYNYGLDRNYVQADGYLNRVLEYRKSKAYTSRGKVRLAQLYNSIGGAYLRSRRYEESRDAYRKANTIAVTELGENSPGAIYTLSNIGLTYIDIQDDSAGWYLKRALEKVIAHLPDQKFVIGNSYLNLGMTEYNLGNYAEALKSYKSAIANIRQTTRGFHNYFSKCYNELGAISLKLGQLDSAEIYFDKAIKANILNDSIDSNSLSDEPSDYLSLHNLVTSIYRKAQLLLKSDELDESSLNAMIDQLDLGILLIEKFIRNLSIQEKTEDSLNTLLHQLNLYSSQLTLRLHELTSDEKYLEQFLGYAELDRAGSLRALISKENAIYVVGIPDSIRGKLQSLDQKVSLAKSQIVRKPANNPEGWRELQEITQIRDSYYERIENKYPLFETLRVQSSNIQISMIQESLTDDQLIIEYFTGIDHTYAILLDKASIEIFKLAENDVIDSLIQRQRENTVAQNLEDFNKVSFLLYKTLFSKIDSYISATPDASKRVVIVPDGSISYVSFPSLCTDSLSSSYLMEKYAISYEPSALVATLRKKPTSSAFNLLGVAPDFAFTNDGSLPAAGLEVVRDTLKPLPGVIKEVNLISDVIDGDLYTGETATEYAFKSKAANYGTIHLATHAIVDNENPAHSKLFFDTRSDEIDDGELNAYEIYNLDLNAQLVTLSACNTGFGKIRKGEGVMSLSHAFAYAGVPATVVSLWPASDKSTPELMKYFYENLKNGQSKDVALNNARKQYLTTAQGKARHPFYWGGFVLIGDNKPIEDDKNLLIWLLSGTIVAALILTVYKRTKQASA